MVSLSDCKNPDGSTDWKKYNELEQKERQERRDKGELCYRCDRFNVRSKGHPESCKDCKNIDKMEELHHPSDIRCPKCGYHWRVGNGDYYELYAEGTHEVGCPNCDYEFEVTTYVSYTFTSPERLKESEEEGD